MDAKNYHKAPKAQNANRSRNRADKPPREGNLSQRKEKKDSQSSPAPLLILCSGCCLSPSFSYTLLVVVDTVIGNPVSVKVPIQVIDYL